MNSIEINAPKRIASVEVVTGSLQPNKPDEYKMAVNQLEIRRKNLAEAQEIFAQLAANLNQFYSDLMETTAEKSQHLPLKLLIRSWQKE